MLVRAGMPRRTEHTITDPEAFLADLALVRMRGYALDDGEQELGVRCVAVAVPDAPRAMGMSVSGPTPRMSGDMVAKAAPILARAAADFSEDLGGASPPPARPVDTTAQSTTA